MILLKIEAELRERERESKTRLHHLYNNIISVENLLAAWREFIKDKRRRKDVEQFSVHLTDNIFTLHHELTNKTYKHGGYTAFKINDPKPRDIHKASVRDRLLHHAIYRVLSPFFDQKFVFDSYSCRKIKGVHRAINRLRKYARTASKSHTKTVWVLKCDVRKFFANIDHKILEDILKKHIKDENAVNLVNKVVDSFHTKNNYGVGLPLGNLTSQLLVNIYMNGFDHFVKRNLKIKHYTRYADDFVVLHESKEYLENVLPKISEYLQTKLKLSLHPDKVSIKTFASGVDFLGWVHFSHHRVPRTSTKKRMFRNLENNPKKGSLSSYNGLLSHGNTHKLRREISEKFAHTEQ